MTPAELEEFKKVNRLGRYAFDANIAQIDHDEIQVSNKKDTKEQLRKIAQELLGRDPGDLFLDHFGKEYNELISAFNENSVSPEEALAKISKDVEASQEAKLYKETGIARSAISGTESFNAVNDVPDWFKTNYTEGDPNEFASGTRDDDWALKINESNLENYLQDQNYQYGTLQGNTVGQEGNEWWGYQKTMAIDHYMSDAGGNYSFATASKLADENVAADIKRNQGHKDFLRYGSIGYGNPLEIKTLGEDNLAGLPGQEATTSLSIDPVYLNFNQKAMDELKAGELHAGTGFTSGTDSAGNLITSGSYRKDPYYIDEDGNVVTGDAIPDDYSGDLITDDPGSGFSYTPSASAPGGYRITAEPESEVAKIISGEISGVGSEGSVTAGLMDARGRYTFDIPENVKNVDSGLFTLPADDPNKLNLSLWKDNPANQLAIETGDLSYKNEGTGIISLDGQLYGGNAAPTGGPDINLGLQDDETLTLNNFDGTQSTLTGGSYSTTSNTTSNNYTTNNQVTEGARNIYYGSGSGGGGKTIIATPPPASKTAKMQQIKDPVRMNAQAVRRKDYNKIRGRAPAQIPGAGGSLNIPVG